MKISIKGVGFWACLAAVAVCATMAFGPVAGMGAFGLLAVAILVFG